MPLTKEQIEFAAKRASGITDRWSEAQQLGTLGIDGDALKDWIQHDSMDSWQTFREELGLKGRSRAMPLNETEMLAMFSAHAHHAFMVGFYCAMDMQAREQADGA